MKLSVPCIKLGNYVDILLSRIHTRVQSLTEIFSFVLLQPSPCARCISPDDGIHIHLHPCAIITTPGMLNKDFGHIINWHLHSEPYPVEFGVALIVVALPVPLSLLLNPRLCPTSSTKNLLLRLTDGPTALSLPTHCLTD